MVADGQRPRVCRVCHEQGASSRVCNPLIPSLSVTGFCRCVRPVGTCSQTACAKASRASTRQWRASSWNHTTNTTATNSVLLPHSLVPVECWLRALVRTTPHKWQGDFVKDLRPHQSDQPATVCCARGFAWISMCGASRVLLVFFFWRRRDGSFFVVVLSFGAVVGS